MPLSQSNIAVTPGSGAQVAFVPITWNSVASNAQAVVPVDPSTSLTPSVTAAGTVPTNCIGIQGAGLGGLVPISGTVGVSGTVTVGGTVAVSSLPALPTGGNAIGSVSVSAVSGNVTTISAAGQAARQAQTATPVAAAATAAAVKSGSGRLFGITITAQGVNPFTITDGSAGTILAIFPANASIGDYPGLAGGKPFNTSLYCNTGSGTPAFTVFYA